jgi:hypothetical protein
VSHNLLSGTWAGLDQTDLRLLLDERIGGPGQYDGRRNVLHLPLAREKCRVSLIYKGANIEAIQPGAAFDAAEWKSVAAEIEAAILRGPRRVGRDISFSTLSVEGWWRGGRSGVQILAPPDTAPRSPGADKPFILEFPVHDAGRWRITNHRRRREHRKLTLVINLLLRGTTKLLPDRPSSFWAYIPKADEIQWVQEFYSADFGEAVIDELSPPSGEKLEEIEAKKYYSKEFWVDDDRLCVPDDLDESVWRYQSLSPALRAKFDRAAYWLSMASRQWEDSISASYASLVSSAEAFAEKSSQHTVYCQQCEKDRSHDVPGAAEKFRAFFEKYTPEPGLKQRRSKMYGLRSMILHGSDLIQLDQGRGLGWDPPWWDEREMTWELWSLMRIAVRNWLKDPA